jgi:Putative MetA-pathway of phenol degradation
MTRRLAIFAMSALFAAPRPAAAQQTVADIVDFLVTNQSVRTSDVERDRAASEAARDTISRALLLNLTSTPLASSSSGFLYKLNPQLGTVERASQSFGAFFVERAQTVGKGRASIGISASTVTFDRLDGFNLKDGTLVTVANQFRDEPSPFETEALRLEVTSRVMTLIGSVGLSDRLEIGAAVPLVELTLDGQRNSVYRGETFLQASGDASASGVGDVAIRGKYTLYSADSAAVAATGEMRLPTGDVTSLLGTGSRSYRIMGVVSYEPGALALHGNAGLVRGGVSDEEIFAGAGSYAVTPRVTLSGELLLRRVAELREVALISAPHPSIAGVDTLRLSAQGDSGDTLANAIAGIKWNVGTTLVIGGHVAIPLRHRGLTAPFTPTLALEFAF